MINKIKSIGIKKLVLIFGVVLLLILLIVLFCTFSGNKKGDLAEEKISEIEVTESELEEYRTRIGTDMDIKKAYLILFDTELECQNFIDNYGAEVDPTSVKAGIVPLMENGYYNIVGKQILETAFDGLADGEYTKEPILYSDMYCYLKRIEIYSPIDDDEALKEIIRNEKYQRLRKDGEQ